MRSLFSLLFLMLLVVLTGCPSEQALMGTQTDFSGIDKSGRPAERVEVSIERQILTAYEAGNPVLQMKVVVGSKQRPTPIMQDRISGVKFAPEWNPPETILNEDIYPRLNKNPKFLKRGWIVYKGGTVIDPDTIDWKSVDPRNYRFVQKSGGKNALGTLRFNHHNPYAIFIHDTPNKQLFNREDRFASSGCIRAHNATKLAEWMFKISDKNLTAREINDMRKGPTKIVNFGRSIPLYVDPV